MDPHVTQEDLDNLRLEPLTHRHLRQYCSPPLTHPLPKKKLVNFNLSSQRKPFVEYSPIKYHSIDNRNSTVCHQPIKEEEDEDLYKDYNDDDDDNGNYHSNDDDVANGNDISDVKKQGSVSSISTVVCKTPPANTWDKVKAKGSNESLRRETICSVVDVVVNKKKGSPAPSIWTPSVPRSLPAPRPGNWREQEEPGNGLYVVSFVSNVLQTKPSKQQIKQKKFQSSSYYQESQSPRQRRKQAEFYGKQYKQWLTDIMQHPSFQEGTLMRGLEIGVQFPVTHMLPLSTNNNSRRIPDSSSSSTHFGLGSDAILNQGVYEEVVSWVPELLVTCPSDPSEWARCFIVIGFKTLDGEFSKVEDQWREWTGSLHIYFNISDDLGLKKLSFFRRKSSHLASLFTYIVVIEVDTVTRENFLYLLDLVYRMRMKSMGGYISVYQEYFPKKAKKDSVEKESPMLTSTTAGLFDSSILDINKIHI